MDLAKRVHSFSDDPGPNKGTMATESDIEITGETSTPTPTANPNPSSQASCEPVWAIKKRKTTSDIWIHFNPVGEGWALFSFSSSTLVNTDFQFSIQVKRRRPLVGTVCRRWVPKALVALSIYGVILIDVGLIHQKANRQHWSQQPIQRPRELGYFLKKTHEIYWPNSSSQMRSPSNPSNIQFSKISLHLCNQSSSYMAGQPSKRT